MDSLTQITLGAAVGEVVLGRQLGNKALVWGAVFGTLPDLDVVLTPFLDSVGFIVHHRGMSHSLLAAVVGTLLFTELFRRWYRWRNEEIGHARWATFFLSVFVTHILLDCFTSYGTQIFWPFSDLRVAWSTIYIVDPLYTGPFIACLAPCFFLARKRRVRRALVILGLLISSCYLGSTAWIKIHMNRVFSEALADQGLETQRLLTCPTPFNNVLWYGVAESDPGYHVGYHSLLDHTTDVRFRFVPRRDDLLVDLRDDYGVDRLIWFADGYYAVRPHPDGLVMHILKFGRLDIVGEDEAYPFSYLLRRAGRSELAVESFASPASANLGRRLEGLWNRMLGIRR